MLPHESILRFNQGLLGSSLGSGQGLPTLLAQCASALWAPQTKHSSFVSLILQSCLLLFGIAMCLKKGAVGFWVSLFPFCLIEFLGVGSEG